MCSRDKDLNLGVKRVNSFYLYIHLRSYIVYFQNAEELTEEGLPFLILFHAPEDTESIKKYTALVHSELADQKRTYVLSHVPRGPHKLERQLS